MPYSIGDVLAVAGVLIGLMISAWAMLIGAVLLFGRKTACAQELVSRSPAGALGRGAIVVLTVGLVGRILISQPNGLLKLIGWGLLVVLLATAVIGAGGLVQLIAGRIRQMDPQMPDYAALGRGAALMIVASLMPVIGWFIVVPLVLLISLGAGLHALLSRITLAPQPTAFPQSNSGEM